MQNDMTNVNVLCGDLTALSSPPRKIFDDKVMDYLGRVSEVILHDPQARQYSDVITYAFYVRRVNLNKLKEKYGSKSAKYIGRGLTFHIAPSNVAINFAYTMTVGLLAGNLCIVKASSKKFAQTRIVTQAFKNVLEDAEFRDLIPYVNVVEYARDKQEITEYFSSICNVRIIWGGDVTIGSVRRALIPPRAFDVTFADRYSICVIKAEKVLSCENRESLAKNFYNDTYLYDQNACSSPRLLYWMGDVETVTEAQELFWQAVWEFIRDRYHLETVVAVDKYTALCRAAIDLDILEVPVMRDNLIMRVKLEKLNRSIPEYQAAGGYFYEYRGDGLEELAQVVTEKFQTLSYYGMDKEELLCFVMEHGLKGIDRIVPVGKTADFDLIWDGYHLIRTLSREIYSE